MKTVYKAILILVFFSNILSAQTFIAKAEFPEMNRSDLSGFTIGDKIYSLGGLDSLSMVYNELWQYNTITDTWVKKSDFNEPAMYCQAAVISDKAYLGNYWNGVICTNDWWEYNSANDSWSQKTNTPGKPRFGASTFAWNNDVYIIGGENYDTLLKTSEAYNNVYKYTPSTDSWAELDTFIGGGRTGGIALLDGDNLYYGMGQDDGLGIWYGDLYKYDLINKVWHTLTPIPFTPCVPGGDATFNGIYNGKLVLFEMDWNFEEIDDLNNIYVYDIADDSWTIYPKAVTIPYRIFGWHGQVGDKGYVGQGRNYLTNTFYADIYQFDLAKVITSVEELNPNIFNIKVISTTRNMNISIPGTQSNFQLNIQTIDGKQLRSVHLENENSIDISSLIDGGYIWTISLNGKLVKFGRVIRL